MELTYEDLTERLTEAVRAKAWKIAYELGCNWGTRGAGKSMADDIEACMAGPLVKEALAALPGLGLKIVSIDPTEAMVSEGATAIYPECYDWRVCE